MKIFFSLFKFLLFALPAAAQTSSGQVPPTLFGDDEKRIITDYLFKKAGLPNPTTTSTPDSSEDLNKDDDDEDEPKGKSKAKGKDKNKNKNKKMPPGLAKRKELPPGLAKRHTLPPGLAVRELPEELEELLPPTVEGQQRIIADENIVLIEQATGRVLDIILGLPKSTGGSQ